MHAVYKLLQIVIHVTPRVYAPCTIHKQLPKNNRLAQTLQHMNWRIAVGSQCVVALVRVLTLVQGEAREPRLKIDREKEAETEEKVVTGRTARTLFQI